MQIDFGIKDLIDILLVAFFLYKTYGLMKLSGTLAVFTGLLSFLVLWFLISQVLEMRLMGAILDKFVSIGFFIIAILFQEEIKRFFLAMGSNRGWKKLVKIFAPKGKVDSEDISATTAIVRACMAMAKDKTGALIVVQQDMNLTTYARMGEYLDANISTRLIQNIFFKNSPLHDGALIINRKKLIAAACILPVSQKEDIPKHLGLRHRAALGLSQECDAKVIVVSEETGNISLAHRGKLYLKIHGEELQRLLTAHYHEMDVQ
ncbi:membrane protein [Bacteroidales bacterium]|nr:membrane protein [Bacteroidales bacterium]